jgi:hypothetical protein
MEQWVTTTGELSAGGRYASLTEGAAYRCPIHSSSISAVPHIPTAYIYLTATYQFGHSTFHPVDDVLSDWAPQRISGYREKAMQAGAVAVLHKRVNEQDLLVYSCGFENGSRPRLFASTADEGMHDCSAQPRPLPFFGCDHV